MEEETVEEDPLPGGDGKTTTSADADTTLLFTKPVGTSNMGGNSDIFRGTYIYMTHSQMLGKFEYTRGPIFKVVLEC